MINIIFKMTKRIQRQKKILMTRKLAYEALDALYEPLEYSVLCPDCEKRAFDISELPESLIMIGLRCPHCNKIVQTPVFAA